MEPIAKPSFLPPLPAPHEREGTSRALQPVLHEPHPNRTIRMDGLMDALDGNAIADDLVDVFGAEMTTAVGTCANCGARSPRAHREVYLRGHSAVGRRRACDNVLLVLVDVRGITCVDLLGLAAPE